MSILHVNGIIVYCTFEFKPVTVSSLNYFYADSEQTERIRFSGSQNIN